MADNDAVAAAAKAATSINGVKVTYASAVVWENGALTDAATKAGWTADNLSVSADGCNLTVKISNADAFKPVTNNKAIKVTYKTQLDKGAYVDALTNAGVTFAEGAPEYDLQNAAALTVGSLKVSSSDKQTFKPDVPVEATKENEGHPGDDLATTRFSATGKTGEVKRLNFSLTDQVDTVDGTDAAKRDATLKAIKLTSLQVVISNPNTGTATYSAENILKGSVAGVSLVRADGSALTLGEVGAADWKLVYDELAAGTEVKVTYDVAVDREAYLAAGGEEGDTVTLQNALTVGSQDGTTDADSSKGQITIQKQIAKSGALSEEKADNGNAIITWNFDVYLENSFSAEQLAKLESVQVRDQLNPALKADASMVKVYDLKVSDGKLSQGDELAAGDYEVTVSDANLLTITLKNPQDHRNIRIVAPTELAASLDSVSNTAELVVDGKVINKDEVEEPGSDAAGQWGSIVSVKTPVFTPSAEKYVDGLKAGAEYEGQFTFTCIEVDKDGNEVAGGYSATATNDAEGVATFEQIVYQAQPREGTHYYRIAETAGEGDFVYDTTVYTVQVTVVKNQKDGRYLVSGVVKTPADAATARFDNSSKRDLTVTKAWDDNDDAAGARPASVTVRLYQNGEAVEGEGATAVLSEANNWTYTWKDLPIAGGEYSVVEDEVKNYSAEASKVELGEDGVWTIKLTNTYAPTVRDLSVTKAWDDNNDAAGKRPDHVVVTLRQGGKAVAGGTVVLNEENNWTYTWNDLAIEGGEYTVTEDKVDGYEASVGAVELGEDGVWRVTVTNKLEEEKPETRSLAVTKVWDDDDNLDELRPTSVTVRLCKDGKPVEGAAVELSEANNWTYTWSGLDKDGNYSVAEDEVENYTTKIGTLELGEDGVWRVTVTNRISDEVRDKRKKKEKPTDETPTSPSSDNKKRGNGGGDYSEAGSTTSKPKVPYTGDTAIPVAPLAVAGVALVGVAGYLVVRSRKQD